MDKRIISKQPSSDSILATHGTDVQTSTKFGPSAAANEAQAGTQLYC